MVKPVTSPVLPDTGIGLTLQHLSAAGHDVSIASNSLLANRANTLNNNLEPNDQNNNSSANAGDDQVGGGGNERREFFEEIRNGGGHWSHLLRQVVLTPPVPLPEITGEHGEEHIAAQIPVEILGGSENGQFAFVGHLNNDVNLWLSVGYLQLGDVILDVQKQQVAGYTQTDVLLLLYHYMRAGSVTLTVAPRGSIGPELRSYLNTRFQKGSVDHALQGVVRDNLYLRTVPVTTRTPRPGETPNVDYTFLSVEDFMELERSGSLLESGVYKGNHYGTPKPWANRLRNNNPQTSANVGEQSKGNSSKAGVLPGMHPSSEGKRRRNRSNVEALGAADDDEPTAGPSVPPPISTTSYPRASPHASRLPPPDDKALGSLPENWEMAYTDKGEIYFIDHNTGTSHWLDPRLSRVQKTKLEECAENELPFGWERIDDPHYGTYYIDHVNRRTQFENPVVLAKKSKSPTNDEVSEMGRDEAQSANMTMTQGASSSHQPPSASQTRLPRGKSLEFLDQQNPSAVSLSQVPTNMSNNGVRMKSAERTGVRFFTRNPAELVGERIRSVLIKSPRGLGFTIVGGDDDDGLDEFLQIKSVVMDGPAWMDGKLRTGDVLVMVNDQCVLGFTHQEMVSIFQGIAPGEEVHLEACRGYPLPFDPADPNTEIVTTVAVAPDSSQENHGFPRQREWTGRPSSPDSVAHSAHSLPELSADRETNGRPMGGRPASVDLLLDAPGHVTLDKKFSVIEQAIHLTVGIIKGSAGFGFTITDSVAGQKVKKVLDPTHCGGLEEGDRLIAINEIDLRGLSHTQVVQVLKDFPLGREATLTIQRSTSPAQFGFKASPGGYPNFHSGQMNNYSDSRVNQNRPFISPRSKTPTAELGRSRPKVRDTLPERPKTPLLDSYGQINGNYFNGDMHNATPSSIPYTHPLLSDRYSTSSVAMSAAETMGTDINPMLIRDWIEMTVDLQRRQEGFGFRIVGGTEEGSQVSVGHIVPRGAAALDGRLQTNDRIIAVDGTSVAGASHHSVVQLMARSASLGRVRLIIRRPIYGPAIIGNEALSSADHSPLQALPVHVTLRRQPSEGFGFVIISSASRAGATIGRIVEGSPADKCGHLHVGDRILAVNQIDISQLHHSQVVQLIKDSGFTLTLSVMSNNFAPQSPISNSIQQPSHISPTVTSMTLNDLETLSLKDNHGYDMGTAFISPESHPIQFVPNGGFTPDSPEIYAVQLQRGARGFGFSIRGGKEFQNMPLFVLRLAEEGPATLDGRMQVGDQILEINGCNTQGMTHAEAIHIIKSGAHAVRLLLRRGSVPFPYLSHLPNLSSGGIFGSSNGQEEEQSISSNNDPQFIGQNSPMYRDQQISFAPQS